MNKQTDSNILNKITEKKKRKMTEITAERRLTRSDQTPVLQRLVNTIRINHYPADSVICFVNTYPLDSNLSDG